MKSYRDEETLMVNDVYYSMYEPMVKELLTRCEVFVETSEGDDEHIVGYVLYGEKEGIPLVHWVYVKYPYRKMGIARKMLDEVVPNGGFCTFANRFFKIAGPKWGLAYDPRLR